MGVQPTILQAVAWDDYACSIVSDGSLPRPWIALYWLLCALTRRGLQNISKSLVEPSEGTTNGVGGKSIKSFVEPREGNKNDEGGSPGPQM